MNKVKIIRKFFSISGANREATYQRLLGKKENTLIAKVEIVSAYKLYLVNGWFKNNPFKKLGIPMVDCFMVIVHYSANFCNSVSIADVKKKIVNSVKKGIVRSSFFIVKTIPTVLDMFETKSCLENKLSTTIGIRYSHLTHCSKGKNKMSLFIQPLNLHYMIAA